VQEALRRAEEVYERLEAKFELKAKFEAGVSGLIQRLPDSSI